MQGRGSHHLRRGRGTAGKHTSTSSDPAAEQRMSSSCMGRAGVPTKRVLRGVTARLGLRRGATGKPSTSTYVPMNRAEAEAGMDAPDAWLGGLRKEVRTCEYSDVHVMWEMLSNTTAGEGTGGGAMPDIMTGAVGKKGAVARRRVRRGRKTAAWSRLIAYCCAF